MMQKVTLLPVVPYPIVWGCHVESQWKCFLTADPLPILDGQCLKSGHSVCFHRNGRNSPPSSQPGKESRYLWCPSNIYVSPTLPHSLTPVCYHSIHFLFREITLNYS